MPFSGMMKLKLEFFKGMLNKITKEYLQGVYAILRNGMEFKDKIMLYCFSEM